MVFHCYWATVPVYIAAELFGAVFAALLMMPLYGFGPCLEEHQDDTEVSLGFCCFTIMPHYSVHLHAAKLKAWSVLWHHSRPA